MALAPATVETTPAAAPASSVAPAATPASAVPAPSGANDIDSAASGAKELTEADIGDLLASGGVEEDVGDFDGGTPAPAPAPAAPDKAAGVGVTPGAAAPVPPTPAPAAPTPATPAAPAAPAQATTPQPAQPAPAAAPQVTADAIRQNYQAARTEAEKLLAAQHFKLTDEQTALLETNPAQVIPTLMSRVYMDATTAAVSHLVTHLPQMIDAVIEGRTKSSEGEKAFFDAWPQLKEHKDAVYRLGVAYRQLNPNVPADVFIKEVGAQAVVALKLAATQAPAAATAPQVPAGIAASVPFAPAGSSGGAGAVKLAPSNMNPFAALAEHEDDED